MMVEGSKPCIVISTAAAAKEVFRQSNDAILSDRPKTLMAKIGSDNFRTVAHAPHGGSCGGSTAASSCPRKPLNPTDVCERRSFGT